ncbi:putative quinol monooxygenase [Neobacillus drentensis]|jgi:quinol monooxygenase YgiN|uniref:putative quinol monooxygenase n=1 Tax=Neobacillus drentensis TaxID=220684 RepID=UPI000BF78150|nr:antibiotic biosynthesis monooxygenase [Bacillus sp. AFS006103]
MIILVAKYYCIPGKGDEVQAYLREMEPLVDEYEKGCTAYFANRSTENKDQFLLYEQYVDQAAFDAHRETLHFREIIEGKIIPILEKRVREIYTPIQ